MKIAKSRKSLKKHIRRSFNGLYLDLVFYEAFSTNPNIEAARNLINEMIEAENELMRRVSVNEGKYVTGRVKHYFQKLDEDLNSKIEDLSKKITALS